MTTFAQESFERAQQRYQDVDVGAGALYGLIGSLINDELFDTAQAISIAAYRIHQPDDQFIVEEVTTYTEVFLEVFRRVFFSELEGESTDEARHRALVGANILSDLALQV